MNAEFVMLVLVQGAMLGLLAWAHRVRPSRPGALFSPAAWFMLFYLLVFWLPQLFMPAFDFTLIGAYNVIRDQQLERVIETQRVLTAFLVPFTLGFFLVARRPAGELGYQRLDGADRRAGLVALLAGCVGVVAILLGFDQSNARSIIVASSFGKMVYAVSFWFTLGYMVLSAWLISRKRYVLLLALTAVFASLLLPLGGRGRILWPIAGLVAWSAMTGHHRIRTWKLVAAVCVLLVLLQMLDPILLYWRGYDSADEAIERFQRGLALETMLYGRNFDAFHNLAVIVGEDRVPTRLRFLIDGSQAAFMTAYFPSVAWNGVGYPATLPGGLWLAGRLPAVLFGGFGFGLFLGFLTRVYRRLQSEFAVVVYCIAMPWLAHVGISYLDSFLKMATLILPGVLLAILRRRSNPMFNQLPVPA